MDQIKMQTNQISKFLLQKTFKKLEKAISSNQDLFEELSLNLNPDQDQTYEEEAIWEAIQSENNWEEIDEKQIFIDFQVFKSSYEAKIEQDRLNLSKLPAEELSDLKNSLHQVQTKVFSQFMRSEQLIEKLKEKQYQSIAVIKSLKRALESLGSTQKCEAGDVIFEELEKVLIISEGFKEENRINLGIKIQKMKEVGRKVEGLKIEGEEENLIKSKIKRI